MSDEPPIKYKWKQEPGGVWEIYHGNDGDRRMGRVEGAVVGKHYLWFMTFNHGINDPKVAVSLNGAAESAREAAAACERCYEAVLNVTWPGMTVALRDRLLKQEQEMKDSKAEWERERRRRDSGLRIVD